MDDVQQEAMADVVAADPQEAPIGEPQKDAVVEQHAEQTDDQQQATIEERPKPADEDRMKALRARLYDYVARGAFEDDAVVRKKAERTAFLQKLMGGPELLSWLAPQDGVATDEVLREHLAQLQKFVRYTLQYAVDETLPLSTSLAAAATATNMIRTSVAIARDLGGSNPKTVHGGRRRMRSQD